MGSCWMVLWHGKQKKWQWTHLRHVLQSPEILLRISRKALSETHPCSLLLSI
jgi:hypothetical protein